MILTLQGAIRFGAVAQSSGAPQNYPEIAWLGRSTYCNPYLGFRFVLPAEFKPEPVYLPVQPPGQHMLLAMHLQRLDRAADLTISAFEDSSEDPAHLAAKARVKQAHQAGLTSTGPRSVLIQGHEFYHLHIANDAPSSSNESSYYFVARGYVVHIAIFSHERDLAAMLESGMEHLEFVEPGDASCMPARAGKASAGLESASADLYYGPALPTGLVDSTVREAPGYSVPSGQYSRRTFTNPQLGVRVELPPDWEALPTEEAYRVTELMRDPTSDPGLTDRRRAMFRACSRVVFTAANPKVEMIPEVHPGFAIVAMRQGCIPDLVLPTLPGDRAASEDFATVLARSLGLTLLGHGHSHAHADGHLTFDLDGTLPYSLPGETLARRLSLRVSATASGQWIVFVYSVTPTPAAQRELESRILIGVADSGVEQ